VKKQFAIRRYPELDKAVRLLSSIFCGGVSWSDFSTEEQFGATEVDLMVSTNFYKSLAGAATAVVLCFGFGSIPALAGPDEDFAEGKISYQRADFSTAIPVLRRAAEAGHSDAQVLLASILDAADSDDEAVAWYKKAADKGNPDGIFGLAGMLFSGEGAAKDVKAARELYTRAAETGHKGAIAALAQGYIRGDLDIPESERVGKVALKWISLAADDGILVALDALEQAYRVGGYGLPPDVAKANELKKKSDKIRGVKEGKKGRRRGEAK
jgi:hypothetical protein